jgi:hypothetical protein
VTYRTKHRMEGIIHNRDRCLFGDACVLALAPIPSTRQAWAKCRTRRSSEPEPAGRTIDKWKIIGGWLPPLAFAFGGLRACRIRRVLYGFGMTKAVANILEKFEQLSEPERRELRQAIVARVPMTDDLTDDDFAALAAASFRALDEEEDSRSA